MKYLLHTFYLLTTLFFITSCGVDRSGEYYALVGDDMWIEEVMKQHYLWYDQIPEISEKDYFAEPEEFLQKLLYSKALDGKGDPFSYVEMKANVSRSFLNQTSTGNDLTHLCASIVCSSRFTGIRSRSSTR